MNRKTAVLISVLGTFLLHACSGDDGGPSPPPAGAVAVAAVPAPQPGTLTYPYIFYFAADGGSPPYTWQASGALPPGLSLGPDGSISGTPTATGTYSFSVTATDSAQTPLSSAPLATQLMIGVPDALVLSATPTPPDGVVGSPYPGFAFSVSGGYQPLGWSVSPGTLPPGLTIGSDGSLTGTPTQVGTSSFTVTVTDSAPKPAMSSQPFMIAVTPPPPPTINGSPPPTATVGVAYPPFQFTVTNGAAPFLWTETGALDGLALSSDGLLSGTPIAAGKFPITLGVTDSLSQTAASAPAIIRVSLARSGTFVATGSMTVPRSGHSATLLNTGKVLVAGGALGNSDPTAELFDPSTGTFAATGSMTEARIRHTATLLDVSGAPRFGQVLILGPSDSTAEVYNPSTANFTATGSMTHARTSPTATLLKTGSAKLGMVLVVGGNNVAGDLSTELYDPASGTFTATGSTLVKRAGHTATQLLDGRVLIAGGGSETAELYDPKTGTFALTGSMAVARTGAMAIRLADGTVLIFGAGEPGDLYDPVAGTFEPLGFLSYQSGSGTSLSLRPDGSVLAAGGLNIYHCGRGHTPNSHSVADAALFGPESDGFTPASSLNEARDLHTATTLPDGSVLVAGGVWHDDLTHPVGRGGCAVTKQTTILSKAELFK